MDAKERALRRAGATLAGMVALGAPASLAYWSISKWGFPWWLTAVLLGFVYVLYADWNIRTPPALGRPWQLAYHIVLSSGMSAAGLAIAYAWFEVSCFGANPEPATQAVCTAIQTQPPWTLLTGIGAAPPALLTWYWRNIRAERELAAKTASDQGDTE